MSRVKQFLSLLVISLLVAGISGCYDDSDLKNSVSELEKKLEALEALVNKANGDIATMQVLVNALNAGKVITNVATTSDGHVITFNDGSSIPVVNGAPGANAPVIGVQEEGGKYYWTLATGTSASWITTSDGQKLPVSGDDGVTPVMGVDADGYWTVNGTRVNDASGLPVKASGEDGGGAFFSSVTWDDASVTFTLPDDTVLTLPRAGTLAIIAGIDDEVWLKYGESASFPVAITGEATVIITRPDGWNVILRDGALSITAPVLANVFAGKDGEISITAIGATSTVNKTFAVSARDYNHVIDFEDARVEDYLAGPTAAGENLYESYAGDDRYFGYDDAATGLFMMINDAYGAVDFWNGGVAISRWNDTTSGSYQNQCSVYYKDATTGNGGYNGSRTFAVHTGYADAFSYSDGRSLITFNDPGTSCIFDHFFVCNTTYGVHAARYGAYPASPLAYDNKGWLKLVVEGVAADDSATGTIEFYLVDFREASSPGILAGWQRVDLLPLGEVTALRFNIQGSDVGQYGLNSPAYFAFDNLAVKLP
jgi:hypothetical protein